MEPSVDLVTGCRLNLRGVALVPQSGLRRCANFLALAIARALLYMRAHSTGGFSLFLLQGTAPVAGFSPPN
jgi:hypothetical protein